MTSKKTQIADLEKTVAELNERNIQLATLSIDWKAEYTALKEAQLAERGKIFDANLKAAEKVKADSDKAVEAERFAAKLAQIRGGKIDVADLRSVVTADYPMRDGGRRSLVLSFGGGAVEQAIFKALTVPSTSTAAFNYAFPANFIWPKTIIA